MSQGSSRFTSSSLLTQLNGEAQAQECHKACWQEQASIRLERGQSYWWPLEEVPTVPSRVPAPKQATDFKDWQTSPCSLSCCLEHLLLGVREKLVPWLPVQCGSFHLQAVVKPSPRKWDSRKLSMSQLCFAAEQHCRVKRRLHLPFISPLKYYALQSLLSVKLWSGQTSETVNSRN